MTTQAMEWRHIDKSAWGDGPWQQEPDKVQWVDEATGLDCLAVRSPGHGALCGYVGVGEGHPLFEKRWDDVDGVEVHGGLTYAAFCDEGAEEGHGICHVPLPGRPGHVWWLGFDCAHAYDETPGSNARLPEYLRKPRREWEEYRTLDYVRAECAVLAQQLAAIGAGAVTSPSPAGGPDAASV